MPRSLRQQYPSLPRNQETAIRDLDDLVAKGILEKVGTTGRGVHYTLAKKGDVLGTKGITRATASQGDITGTKGTSTVPCCFLQGARNHTL